eukprot:TRINITY_DN7387_c0_g1_i2.p1 TRINITY_DN7387_c0_g1~~TRINITY_DN7387_c0_g1_i2.p1  ORF type:complete len:360 (-),score=45.00 TRINITY_DN7387_c0_g1_i2:289-1368(-)
MQKIEDFRRFGGENALETARKLQYDSTSKKTKVKGDGGKPDITVCGLKIRIKSKGHVIIDDLYNTLACLVASARGQCGLIEATEEFRFKSRDQIKRRSQSKYLVELIKVDRELGEREEFFLGNSGSIHEVTALGCFLSNITLLFEQRGICIADTPVPVPQRDRKVRFWISDATLRSQNDTFEAGRELENGTESSFYFQSLVDNHEKLKKVLRTLERIIKSRKRFGMSKFQTRHNVKMLIFSHGSYVQNFDAVTLECFSCLKSMKNASIIYNMLEDKNAKGQGLPQEWPIREFELKLNYAGSNLALWKDKIPSMNTPFTRTRVCLPWATTQRNIDTACNNLLEICNEITSLSQLIIDVRR